MIRVAVSEDDAALRNLDVGTWSHDVTPAPVPSRDAAFFRPGTCPEDILVAEVDGLVAGYIKLGPALPLDSSKHVLEVQGLAVDPAQGRRGLGRALVTAAVQEANVRGARRLTLRVLGTNTAARALYESCGFVVEGVLREEFGLGGRYVDDVLMALTLPH
ncbi:MAG TPA: GNAT family N-acetyltransferase [Candidatus Dormibacteraeota bacterium]|nr:GNAT family N-acetyltransferase [Candidatus Dormibacteraeota bacterium]